MSPSSMSVPQAMEWLIEHAEDPAIDTPLPGQAAPAAAGATAATSEAEAGAAEGDEERDELTEIFKKIRRKREFRADARVRVHTDICAACVGEPSRSTPVLPSADLPESRGLKS